MPFAPELVSFAAGPVSAMMSAGIPVVENPAGGAEDADRTFSTVARLDAGNQRIANSFDADGGQIDAGARRCSIVGNGLDREGSGPRYFASTVSPLSSMC